MPDSGPNDAALRAVETRRVRKAEGSRRRGNTVAQAEIEEREDHREIEEDSAEWGHREEEGYLD